MTNMKQKLLYLFTRTPLHIGAGLTVGLTDQPIQRERHTGFPIIPGSTLKGGFARAWTDSSGQRTEEGNWLFGSEAATPAGGGALQFTEAKLLAFPIRSARGSFAWITCPLILRRFARDGDMPEAWLPPLAPRDDQALFTKAGPLALIAGQDVKIVLEDFTFSYGGELPGPANPPAPPAPRHAGEYLKNLLHKDPVWSEAGQRLVILNDGMMSFFCQSACEVVPHIQVDDARGAGSSEACFTQENVPSETLFYAGLNCLDERIRRKPKNLALDAGGAFAAQIEGRVFQFGGDATTGLGCCTIELRDTQPPAD